MALVELVIERIDLDHRITRHRGCLYAGDVGVTDARHLTAEVRPVAVTAARRRSAKDPPLTNPGLITSNLSSKAMMHWPSMPSMPNRTCSCSSMESSRSHLTLLSYTHGPSRPAFCCVNSTPLPPTAYALQEDSISMNRPPRVCMYGSHPPESSARPQKYSGQRSRSCQESAIASPCNRLWSCHNASACGSVLTSYIEGQCRLLYYCNKIGRA